MGEERLVLVADDPQLADEVQRLATGRGMVCRRIDPSADALDDETLFEVAFESRATGIVLLERLGRWDGPAVRANDDGMRAALAASKAPGVGFIAWVTPRPENDSALQNLRRLGIPYGVLRAGPLFEVATDLAAGGRPRRPVLVARELADALANARAVATQQVAEQIVAAIEQQWVREGRCESVRPFERPLEQQVEALGLEPQVLTSWRVGLNAFFGLPVLEPVPAGEDGRLIAHRRPLRARSVRVASAPEDDSGVAMHEAAAAA